MNFAWKNKTEKLTSNDSLIRKRVREKSRSTRYANRNVDDIASEFSFFFSRFIASRNWHIYKYGRKLETRK